MTELQTRYVTSADGTRIATSTLGRGRPLIAVFEIWMSSMESYWQVPQVRKGLEQLARRRTVVRFDLRGVGLSERQVADLSLDARVSDLAAVVDHFGTRCPKRLERLHVRQLDGRNLGWRHAMQ
jgi:pimeloyl-ACP methyl ester carboxylesterase